MLTHRAIYGLFFLCNLCFFVYKNHTMEQAESASIQKILELFKEVPDDQLFSISTQELTPSQIASNYSTYIDNLKKNIESLDVADLLKCFIIYNEDNLKREFFQKRKFFSAVAQCLLKKIYESSVYKKILFEDSFYTTCFIQNILTHQSCHEYDGVINLHIKTIRETSYFSCVTSDYSIQRWLLEIRDLVKLLNKNSEKNEENNDIKESKVWLKILSDNYWKDLVQLRFPQNDTLDFSYLSFLNILFNREIDNKNLYILKKYSGATDPNSWNVRMIIATIFIVILFPVLANEQQSNTVFVGPLSYDPKKFNAIEKIILDHTDLTTLDLRFWINLFPNLKTISVVGCKLTSLSSADKLFLAGWNVYGNNNQGALEIMIDSEQVASIQPTILDYIFMFLQDGFGGYSTKNDIGTDVDSTFSSIEYNMIEPNLLPHCMSLCISIFTHFPYTTQLSKIYICISIIYFYYNTRMRQPFFGGRFGLESKNQLWQRNALAWIPLYIFSITQIINAKKRRLSLIKLLIIGFSARQGFNYKAFIHLLCRQYSIKNKYTIINDSHSPKQT